MSRFNSFTLFFTHWIFKKIKDWIKQKNKLEQPSPFNLLNRKTCNITALYASIVKIKAPDSNYCYGSRFVFVQCAGRFYGCLDMKTSKMNYWCKITKLVWTSWAHSTITRSINRFVNMKTWLFLDGRLIPRGCFFIDAIGELARNRCIKTASRETSLLLFKGWNWNSFRLLLPSNIWMVTFDELSDPAICYRFIIRWLYRLSLVSLYCFRKLGFSYIYLPII